MTRADKPGTSQEACAWGFKKIENCHIPPDFDYMSLKALSAEGKEKLLKYRPYTLAQAAQISGVSPSHGLYRMTRADTPGTSQEACAWKNQEACAWKNQEAAPEEI